MVKSLFSLLVLLIVVHTVHAQIGVTALIKTKFTDARTGQPVSLKYELVPSGGGAKIRGSTPSSGEFEQILTPGETYKVNCRMADGIAAPITFTLKPSSSYYELSQTLAVKILKKDDILGDWTLFQTAKSTLTSESDLMGIKDMITANRGLYVSISVAGDMEVKGKAIAKAAKKPKPVKKSKKTTAAVEQPIVDIVAERVAAVNAFFAQNLKPEALKRVTVKSGASRAGSNAWAVVGDIKSMD
ncbi:MAG: hypothetical protein HYZ54_00955 [Ignavibacteriae bacterium]|nr:hypothetical protein [Ignavibacteriota bacterium]